MHLDTLLAGWDSPDLASIPSQCLSQDSGIFVLPYHSANILPHWVRFIQHIPHFGDLEGLNSYLFSSSASEVLSILDSVYQFTGDIPAHVYSNLVIQYERISRSRPSHWIFDTLWRTIIGLMSDFIRFTGSKTVIFRVFPHLFSDYCLYLAAQYNGCRVYIIQPLRGLSPFIRCEYADLNNFVYAQVYELNPLRRLNLATYISASPSLNMSFAIESLYKHIISIKSDLSSNSAASASSAYATNLRLTLNKNLNEGFSSLHRTEVVEAINYLASLKRNYALFESSYDMCTNNPFIFFPLHKQPEASTSPAGGVIWNHECIIRELSRACLSSQLTLVVKEHPHMFKWSPTNSYHFLRSNKFSRDLVFYERIVKSSKNVHFVPLDQPPECILGHANCLGVFSIEGTLGISALLAGKPLMCSGEPWYKDHPSVTSINNLSDLRSLCVDGLTSNCDIDFMSVMRQSINHACINNVVAMNYNSLGESSDLYRLMCFLSR